MRSKEEGYQRGCCYSRGSRPWARTERLMGKTDVRRDMERVVGLEVHRELEGRGEGNRVIRTNSSGVSRAIEESKQAEEVEGEVQGQNREIIDLHNTIENVIGTMWYDKVRVAGKESEKAGK